MNKQVFFLCCISLVVSSFYASPDFDSLQEVDRYTKRFEEYPEADNDDRFNPDYGSFHRKHYKGTLGRTWDRFLSRVGLGKGAGWSANYFQSLLKKVTQDWESRGRTGRFVEKISVPSTSRFIIWGDVQGALHSLTRDLNKLKEMGIIDDAFKIINPNHYFIFAGDVIDRSPYILETLTVMLKLLAVNPKNVFYIRGNHEDREGWRDRGLVRELLIRARHVSQEKIPLKSLIKRFFRTLPLALYLKFDSGDIVRISHYGRENEELDEQYFSEFLLEKNKTSIFNLKDRKLSGKKVSITAIIKGVSRSKNYEITDGLKQLSDDKGATAWNLLSSPTSSYRILHQFFYDAFAILDIGQSAQESTITLYHQDVRDMDGFKQRESAFIPEKKAVKKEVVAEKRISFDPIGAKKEVVPAPVLQKGDAIDIGPDKGDKIVVGCAVDLSKGATIYGTGMAKGLFLRFNQENKAGGINGKNLELIVLDHEYDPKKAVDRLEEIISEYKTDVILGQQGSPTLEAMLPSVLSGRVLMLFPYTGSSAFRKPDQKYMGHFRASYRNEGQILAKYAVEKIKARRIVIFYQNDAYGIDGLKGARDVLKKYKEDGSIEPWLETYYLRNTTDVKQAVEKIGLFQPEVIILCSIAPATSALIREMGVENLANVTFMGISPLGREFKNLVESKGLKYIASHVVPNSNSDDLEIVRNYREELERSGSKDVLSSITLEGYINASIFIEILKRIKGTITKEKIRDVMENMKGVQYKGLDLTFHPEIRGFSKKIWLQTDKGWSLHTIDEQKEEKIEVSKKKIKIIGPDRGDKIVIGCLTDLTKGAAPYGIAITNGMSLRFNKENQAGGVNGKNIEMVVLDHQYNPKLAVEKLDELLSKHQTDIVIGQEGTPTLNALLPYVESGEVLMLFPDTGSEAFRKAEQRYMGHFRTSYQKEGSVLVRYAVEKLQARRIVVFYQNDAYGLAGLTGAREELKKYKEQGIIKEWLETYYLRNTTDVRDAVKKIKPFQPEVIIFCSVTGATAVLVKKIGVQNLANVTLLGTSPLGAEFFDFIISKGLKYVVSNAIPNPFSDELEIVREYREEMERSGAKGAISILSLEGYINASIFIEILKRIKGKVTKEKVRDAMEGMQGVKYKGLDLTFYPEIRGFSKKIWLQSKKGWTPWAIE